jgi:Fic-DOC domain mobile mystery protein B
MGHAGMNLDDPGGATPLDPSEIESLRLAHISTRAELDRWEQDNITAGEAWAFARKQKDILGDGFMRRLHKRMFGTVWRWAGQFRTSDKNIGAAWWKISTDLKNLSDDVAIWIDSGSYPPDEIAARFHHRLVAIHLFPNGNGRHARTMTDLLLVQRLGRPRFTWGSGNLVDSGACRRQYIDALRSADRYDYRPLMDFVRT